jgi:predicted 3-demethylubiquinone-9 3-methyltransferase (glyoxalase superfamily)
MQKITPFLWFDGQAEDAVKFYLSVFKDGKVHTTTRYPEGSPGENRAGTVMTIAFELHGEQFVALNGGPGFPFSNAVSLVVNCESQEEIDYYWEKLAADGGEQIQCGWLKDKFGMPWQIVPGRIWDWLRGEDPARVKRVTAAVWQMEKLDLAELERAAAGDVP